MSLFDSQRQAREGWHFEMPFHDLRCTNVEGILHCGARLHSYVSKGFQLEFVIIDNLRPP